MKMSLALYYLAQAAAGPLDRPAMDGTRQPGPRAASRLHDRDAEAAWVRAVTARNGFGAGETAETVTGQGRPRAG